MAKCYLCKNESSVLLTRGSQKICYSCQSIIIDVVLDYMANGNVSQEIASLHSLKRGDGGKRK